MVALLAEGVDRNSRWFESYTGTLTVALLAEGVDRNCVVPSSFTRRPQSPSSRRAWIEIVHRAYFVLRG